MTISHLCTTQLYFDQSTGTRIANLYVLDQCTHSIIIKALKCKPSVHYECCKHSSLCGDNANSLQVVHVANSRQGQSAACSQLSLPQLSLPCLFTSCTCVYTTPVLNEVIRLQLCDIICAQDTVQLYRFVQVFSLTSTIELMLHARHYCHVNHTR